jgi:hypothetical protein
LHRIISIYKNNSAAFQSAGLFFLIGVLFCCFVGNSPVGDFGNYYFGSKFALDPALKKSIYDCWEFNRAITVHQADPDAFYNYTPVPPFSLLFYLPFVFFKLPLAKFLFSFFSLTFFCVSWFRLVKRYSPKNVLCLLAPLIFLAPLKANIEQGQSYLLVCALLIESFLSWNEGKKLLPALLLAIAIGLKIFPVFLLVFFIFHRAYKFTIYALGFSLLLFVLSAAFSGPEIVLNYFAEILPRLGRGEINDPWATSYQSFEVMMRRLFVRDEWLNPQSLHAPLLFASLCAIFVATILSFLYSFLKRNKDTLLKFSVTVFCIGLVSGYGTTYALLLNVFVFQAIVFMPFSGKKRCILLILLALLNNFPSFYFFHFNTFAAFPRLYFYLLLFAFLLFFSGTRFHWRSFAVLVPLLALLKWNTVSSKPDGDLLAFADSVPILQTYFSEEPYLRLSWLDKKFLYGGLRENIYSDSLLTMKKGQIFYKRKQLTYSNSRKRKPLRYGANRIIFLSDEGRGVGFYALRITELER